MTTANNKEVITSNVDFYEQFAPLYKQYYADVCPDIIVKQWIALLEHLECIPEAKSRGNGNMLLLDIGCGPGWYLPEWSRAGFHVAGLDSSAKMLELAEQHFHKSCPGTVCPFYKVDICEIDNQSDIPQCELAVSHFNFLNLFAPEQLTSVFAGVKKLLRPGGIWVTDFCEAEGILEDFDESFVLNSSDQSLNRSRRYVSSGGYHSVRLTSKNIDISEKYWLKNTDSIVASASQLDFELVGCFEWDYQGKFQESVQSDSVRQLLGVFRLESSTYDRPSS
jgi:SAM-dependent methyltransferase